MNRKKPTLRLAALGLAFGAAALASGCAAWDNLSRADKGTAAGAVVGGVVGSAVTGGGTLGTVGGAVVGGVVGREAAKR